MTNKATRIIVKAIGEVLMNLFLFHHRNNSLCFQLDTVIFSNVGAIPDDYTNLDEAQENYSLSLTEEAVDLSQAVDIRSYTPVINEKGEWLLTETDLGTTEMSWRVIAKFYSLILEWISEGCGILGTGGGGSPYPPFIM